MKLLRLLFRLVRAVLVAAGLFLILVVALAGTKFPWNWYGSMAHPGRNADRPPDVLVMMGGGGIPSESGLMRSWKAAEAARLFTNALVVIAMPDDGTETPTYGIGHELVLRGVDPARLRREPTGRNTREQAVAVFAMFQPAPERPLTLGLVTSPEHMKRTWLTFRKAGFDHLVALPSWPEAIKVDMRYDEAELGAPSLGGLVGGNDFLKYKIWDNIGLMMRCTRETIAIWYYRAMGWI